MNRGPQAVCCAEPLPLDRIVSAFWPHIRALLGVGLGPQEIGAILVSALADMGHGNAIASIDLTLQIEQLRQSLPTNSAAPTAASGRSSSGMLDRPGAPLVG